MQLNYYRVRTLLSTIEQTQAANPTTKVRPKRAYAHYLPPPPNRNPNLTDKWLQEPRRLKREPLSFL